MEFWADLPDAIRYPVAFLLPLIATVVLTPFAGRVAHRYQILDRPNEPGASHKTHGVATPYLGGLAVGMGMTALGVLVAGFNGQLLTVLGSALMLAIVGLADDVHTLDPRVRLGFEAAAAVALWSVGVRAGAFETMWLDLPLTVLWVVAVVNAFNMIDNMDGIASGVAAAAAAGIAVITAAGGDFLIASFALATAGAATGFLRYNAPPASIFLGDAGSMMLGFLVASLALGIDLQVTAVAPRMLTALLLAAVPLFDLSVVVVSRLRDGRPLLRGGTDHTAHRLHAGGRSRMHVLVGAILVQAMCSTLAIVLISQPHDVVVAVGASIALVWCGLLIACLRMPSLTIILDPEIESLETPLRAGSRP